MKSADVGLALDPSRLRKRTISEQPLKEVEAIGLVKACDASAPPEKVLNSVVTIKREAGAKPFVLSQVELEPVPNKVRLVRIH